MVFGQDIRDRSEVLLAKSEGANAGACLHMSTWRINTLESISYIAVSVDMGDSGSVQAERVSVLPCRQLVIQPSRPTRPGHHRLECKLLATMDKDLASQSVTLPVRPSSA